MGALAAMAAAPVGTSLMDPRVVKHRVPLKGLSSNRPLTAAVLADPHMNTPWMSLERFERIAEHAAALQPDLVFLVGDYESNHGDPVDMHAFARICANISTRHGVFAVLGNHDYASDPTRPEWKGRGTPRCVAAFEAAGVHLLRNASQDVDTLSGPVTIAGLDSQTYNLHRPDFALRDVGGHGPAILLAHEPDVFAHHDPRVALTISGHMHNAQFNLMGWTPGPLPSRYGKRYLYGHIEEDGHHLVVSGGLGCSRAPLRLGAAPEIVHLICEPSPAEMRVGKAIAPPLSSQS